MIQEDILSLSINLPEDIFKAKWAGDFSRAIRLINRYLQEEKTPQFLKKRLQVEKEILERFPLDYTFTEEEAVAFVQKEIPDFSLEELEHWMDQGTIEWTYIHGKPKLASRFYEALQDVYPQIAVRAGKIKQDFEETPGSILKNEHIRKIKASGKTAHHIRLKMSVRIKDEFYKEGKVLVHLPLPKPQMNMKNIKILSTFPEASEKCTVEIGSEDQPARTVSFREEMTENHLFSVEFEYDCLADYCDFKPSSKEGDSMQPVSEEEKERFEVREDDLAELPPHIMFTPTIKALAEELTKGLDDDLSKARAFYDYITTKITYCYMRQYFTLERIPEYAILGRKGDCGVQALTFITLCRAAGIPARWQSALYVTPDVLDKDGNVLEKAEGGMHDWAMVYLKPWGWRFVDASFGGSAYRAGNLERWDYYFGNLDPFRMAANDAFQAPLYPKKKMTRFDPYDNQVGEIEYEDRPISRTEMDRRIEVLEHTPIE